MNTLTHRSVKNKILSFLAIFLLFGVIYSNELIETFDVGSVFAISGWNHSNVEHPDSSYFQVEYLGSREQSILWGDGMNGQISLWVFGGYGYGFEYYSVASYINELWIKSIDDQINWLYATDCDSQADFSEMGSFEKWDACPPAVAAMTSFHLRYLGIMIYYGGVGYYDIAGTTVTHFNTTWAIDYGRFDWIEMDQFDYAQFHRFNCTPDATEESACEGQAEMPKVKGAAGFTFLWTSDRLNGFHASLVLFGGMFIDGNCTNEMFSMEVIDYDDMKELWEEEVWEEEDYIGPSPRAFCSYYTYMTQGFLFGCHNGTHFFNEVWRLHWHMEGESSGWELLSSSDEITHNSYGRNVWGTGFYNVYTFGGQNFLSGNYDHHYEWIDPSIDPSLSIKSLLYQYALDDGWSVAHGAAWVERVEEEETFLFYWDDLFQPPWEFYKKFLYNEFYYFGGRNEDGLKNHLVKIQVTKSIEEIFDIFAAVLFGSYQIFITITIFILFIVVCCCVCCIIWFPICIRCCRACQKQSTAGKNKKRFTNKLKERKKLEKQLLIGALIKCNCEEYEKKFLKAKVLYYDLENLAKQEDTPTCTLRKLIPNDIHRARLIEYVWDEIIKKPRPVKPTIIIQQGPPSLNVGIMPEKEKEFDEDTKKGLEKLRQNKYHIDEKMIEIHGTIASGAFGVVRRGIFKVTEIAELPVAVKEVVVGTGGSSTSLKEVEHEVTIMSEMKHANILKCFGFYEKMGSAFIVMELCEKGDLYKYKKKLSRKQKLNFILQICQGMSYLHNKDLVHRDLKTQNLLVTRDNFVKICDFGTSRHIQSVQNTFCGTVEYLAPEQYDTNLGINANPRSVDIYGFGVIMWEILSGLQPFEAVRKDCKNNQFEMIQAIHKNKKRPDLSVIEKTYPPDLIDLIKACWQHYPYNRPDSFDEIESILMDVVKIESENVKKKSEMLKKKLSQLKKSEKASKSLTKEDANREKTVVTPEPESMNPSITPSLKDGDVELQSINPSISPSINMNPSLRSLAPMKDDEKLERDLGIISPKEDVKVDVEPSKDEIIEEKVIEKKAEKIAEKKEKKSEKRGRKS